MGSRRDFHVEHAAHRAKDALKCGNEWGHDVISTMNMLHIAQMMLCGEERPSWLT
jgi:hypothetical protein